MEEERRLAYVAFTRAKKQLFLTDSEGFSFVTDSPKIASRFIDEVGKEGIKHIGAKPRFKTANYINTSLNKADLIGNNQVKDWTVGDFVMHDTFGKGVDKMFENLDLDTIGYIQYMEQAEKAKQESDKSRKEQENDIRLSQNEYNRPTFR